ncbi:MAG: WD40 repeat domain-containing serine/threonine protein kinase [Verrucomicrobiales bacterium]
MNDPSLNPPACAHCGTPATHPTPDGHCARCLAEVSFAEQEAEDEEAVDTPLPCAFGNYELLEEIGRGGMGVVYRARQIRLQREVALKVLPGGEFARPEFRQRFRREALAAARLQHPNIVAIHEVGEHEGVTFYSMELVTGQTLAKRVAGGPLPTRVAAEYLRAIARAVQHAHDAGILHRDLTPANVLIDRATDQPCITDFGLAKQVPGLEPGTQNSELTMTGQVLGSPAYMPPEQAFGRPRTEGVVGDVYSLGAILYHLLTGRAPFEGLSVNDVLLQVRENDPIPPRKLNARVPADLETICLKCLAKNPSRRYPSAQCLADELGCFLAGRPIRARPVKSVERLWLWCRRRPGIAALAASVLVLLSVVAVGSTIAAWRIASARTAERAERRKSDVANQELRSANRRLAETVSRLELQNAEELFRSEDASLGVAHLAALLRRAPFTAVAASRLVSALVHRDWALPSVPPLAHPAWNPVLPSVFSPNGQQVLTAGDGSSAQVWDSTTGAPQFTLTHEGRVLAANYSSDGTRIVTSSADGTARLWHSIDGTPFAPALKHGGEVRWAEFSSDDRKLVTASTDGFARIWDAKTGNPILEFGEFDALLLRAHFSPDGQWIATVTERGTIQLRNSRQGLLARELTGHRARVHSLAFSPDGQRIIAACDGGLAMIWALTDSQSTGIALIHSPWAPVWHAVFSPDGRVALTSAEDAKARLWNAADGFPMSQPLPHQGGVVFGGFNPDGNLMVTASSDNSARIWNRADGRPLSQALRHPKRVRYAAFDRTSQRLITTSMEFTAQIWDIQPRQIRPAEIQCVSDVTSVAFNPRDGSLLLASLDQTLRIWNPSEKPGSERLMRHSAPVRSGSVSPDGRLAATGCVDGSAFVWEISSGQLLSGPMRHAHSIASVHFNHDSGRIVTAAADGTARVWNAQTGEPVSNPLIHADEVLMARFSPHGRYVVTASKDGTARVWDSRTGDPVTESLPHSAHVRWAEFGPDEEKVVTASTDNTACIWDIRTSRPLAPLLEHARIVEMARFSPDGERVVTVSQDRSARVWDAATGRALTPPLPHLSAATHVAFSPDGQRILTGGWNGMVRQWDVKTGHPLTEWLFAGGLIGGLCFDSTGSRMATGTQEGTARLWDTPPPPTPAPLWFIEFAEAVAGMRLSERGNVELLSRGSLEAAASRFARESEDDFYARLGRWFLAAPAHRSASPY